MEKALPQRKINKAKREEGLPADEEAEPESKVQKLSEGTADIAATGKDLEAHGAQE